MGEANPPPFLFLAFIHRSAWNREFCELRRYPSSYERRRGSFQKDGINGFWWKWSGTRLGSGSGGRGRIPRVLDYMVSAHHVLRAGLQLVSWWPWILYALRPLAHPYRGACGPFLAGLLVVLALTRGKTGCGGVTAPDGTLARGVGSAYAAALGLPSLGSPFTAAAINVFVLGAQPTSSAAELGGWSSLIPTFFILLLIPGLGGTWGGARGSFRGYALPRLQSGRQPSLLASSWGCLWAFWYLPFFMTGARPPGMRVCRLIAWTVVFSLANKTTHRGSVLLAC